MFSLVPSTRIGSVVFVGTGDQEDLCGGQEVTLLKYNYFYFFNIKMQKGANRKACQLCTSD